MPAGLLDRRDSPLTSAALYGRDDMVSLLLQHGADTHAENPEGLTALHATAVSQNVECAAILLKSNGADVNSMSSKGITPLMAAIMHNSYKVLMLFLERAGPLNGERLLPLVATHADVQTTRILRSSGVFDVSQVVDVAACLLARRMGGSTDDALKFAFDELISACTRVRPKPAGRSSHLVK